MPSILSQLTPRSPHHLRISSVVEAVDRPPGVPPPSYSMPPLYTVAAAWECGGRMPALDAARAIPRAIDLSLGDEGEDGST